MDLNAVATGLETQVREVAGIQPYDYVPDALAGKSFLVCEIDVDFDKTFRRGMDELMVTCRVLIARRTERDAQRKLREFMAGGGMTSIKAAIESDKTLGGACDSLHVQRMSGNRMFTVGEKRYYGVEIYIKIVGSGS